MNAAVPQSSPSSQSPLFPTTPFVAADAQVDAAAVQPLPNSRKIYVAGSRPDIQVPMREITQAALMRALRGADHV